MRKSDLELQKRTVQASHGVCRLAHRKLQERGVGAEMLGCKSGTRGPSLSPATNWPRGFTRSGLWHPLLSDACHVPALFFAGVYVGGWGFGSNFIIT